MDIIVRNVVFAAACGASASTWIESNNPIHYDPQCNGAAAFADAIAEKITIVEDPLMAFKLTLLSTICVCVLEDRTLVSTDPKDYDKITNAITALYTQAITKFI